VTVCLPARILPIAPGAVFAAVQEEGVKNAQGNEGNEGEDKEGPGKEHPQTGGHHNSHRQEPGFVPDFPVGKGPGEADPDPGVGAMTPQEHVCGQSQEDDSQQITEEKGRLVHGQSFR